MLKTSSVPTLQLIIEGLKRCGRKRTCGPLHEYTQEKRRFAKICKQILVNDMLICPRSQVKWGQGAFLSSTFTQIPTFREAFYFPHQKQHHHTHFHPHSPTHLLMHSCVPPFTLRTKHHFICILSYANLHHSCHHHLHHHHHYQYHYHCHFHYQRCCLSIDKTSVQSD